MCKHPDPKFLKSDVIKSVALLIIEGLLSANSNLKYAASALCFNISQRISRLDNNHHAYYLDIAIDLVVAICHEPNSDLLTDSLALLLVNAPAEVIEMAQAVYNSDNELVKSLLG
jgi:hypothetical protein